MPSPEADPEVIDRLTIYSVGKSTVVLDSGLAMGCGVETRASNQAFKRNRKRIPEDFAFQLTSNEWDSLRSRIVTLKPRGRGRHRKYLPWVFTEHGPQTISLWGIIVFLFDLNSLSGPERNVEKYG